MSQHHRCPICGHTDDIDFMTLVELENGHRVWMHDDCAVQEGWLDPKAASWARRED